MFVVIGSTTADLLVLSQAPLAIPGGEGFQASNLVFTDTPLRFSMGGNGGNSAYALAGLGVPTALCGSVGQDALGKTLVAWLQARNVNLDGFSLSDTDATSTSVILMSDAANQVVFHHRGANAGIRLGQMPDSLISDADVLLATSYPLLPHMRAGGFARALARVDESGGITALDIGPAIGDPVTIDEITPLLPVTRYLIANTHEITALTGCDDWEHAAERLLSAGARNLVIKQGAAGASLRGSVGDVDVPGFEVEAAVSVGAGDAFNAGFLYGVRREFAPQQAVRFGNAVAALVVGSGRGITGSPSLVEVERLVAAG